MDVFCFFLLHSVVRLLLIFQSVKVQKCGSDPVLTLVKSLISNFLVNFCPLLLTTR